MEIKQVSLVDFRQNMPALLDGLSVVPLVVTKQGIPQAFIVSPAFRGRIEGIFALDQIGADTSERGREAKTRLARLLGCEPESVSGRMEGILEMANLLQQMIDNDIPFPSDEV